jgi:hypothetical protein
VWGGGSLSQMLGMEETALSVSETVIRELLSGPPAPCDLRNRDVREREYAWRLLFSSSTAGIHHAWRYTLPLSLRGVPGSSSCMEKSRRTPL